MFSKKNYPKIYLGKNTLSYTYIELKETNMIFGCELVWNKIIPKIGNILKLYQKGYENKYYKITSILEPKKLDCFHSRYIDKFKFKIIIGSQL